jgi:N-methylhydantoinase A
MPGRPVEVVSLRLQATGAVPKPTLVPEAAVESDGREARLGRKRVVCADGPAEIDLYARPRLVPGANFSGPALAVQMDSTVYVPPGWRAYVDGYRNLVLEHAQASPPDA